MKKAVVGALIGVLFLTIVNVVVVAYGYGRLYERVDNLCNRVARLELIINHGGSND